MDINTQKEEFSYAYVSSVASAAGYKFEIASRPLDMGGIDGSIVGTASEYSFYPPRLEVQVKSTSMPVVSEEFIRYPLKLKNYNELRKRKTLTPRILIVVLIPENSEEWVKQSEVELCLRRCGYWMSLQGEPETKNQESVTVYLPREQLFTVNYLKRMMQNIETGGTL